MCVSQLGGTQPVLRHYSARKPRDSARLLGLLRPQSALETIDYSTRARWLTHDRIAGTGDEPEPTPPDISRAPTPERGAVSTAPGCLI